MITREINCLNCGKKLVGRRDKKYCDHQCKNHYNATIRFINLPIRQRVDRFLHRNHTILYELHQKKKRAHKWYVKRTTLQKMGFRFNTYTSTYINSQDKLYFYVYDFRWMEFSDTTIMVVHNKPKG